MATALEVNHADAEPYARNSHGPPVDFLVTALHRLSEIERAVAALVRAVRTMRAKANILGVHDEGPI
jgi:hypothetical protein